MSALAVSLLPLLATLPSGQMVMTSPDVSGLWGWPQADRLPSGVKVSRLALPSALEASLQDAALKRRECNDTSTSFSGQNVGVGGTGA